MILLPLQRAVWRWVLAGIVFWCGWSSPAALGGVASGVAEPSWRVASSSEVPLLVREWRSQRFQELASGAAVLRGHLIRLPSPPSGQTRSPAVLHLGTTGSGTRLILWPGAMLSLEPRLARVLAGRVQVQHGDGVRPFCLRTRSAQGVAADGEMWLEVDRTGNAVYALKRGTGWIKTLRFGILELSSGKQIGVPVRDAPGQPAEIDDRWKDPPEGFLTLGGEKKRPALSAEELALDAEEDDQGGVEATVDDEVMPEGGLADPIPSDEPPDLDSISPTVGEGPLTSDQDPIRPDPPASGASTPAALDPPETLDPPPGGSPAASVTSPVAPKP